MMTQVKCMTEAIGLKTGVQILCHIVKILLL
jgi:hypothetical protein